jgi:hypothetical protein
VDKHFEREMTEEHLKMNTAPNGGHWGSKRGQGHIWNTPSRSVQNACEDGNIYLPTEIQSYFFG